MTDKKMPRHDARQKLTQPHSTEPRRDFATTEIFERVVGKFGGLLADLPAHLAKRGAA